MVADTGGNPRLAERLAHHIYSGKTVVDSALRMELGRDCFEFSL